MGDLMETLGESFLNAVDTGNQLYESVQSSPYFEATKSGLLLKILVTSCWLTNNVLTRVDISKKFLIPLNSDFFEILDTDRSRFEFNYPDFIPGFFWIPCES